MNAAATLDACWSAASAAVARLWCVRNGDWSVHAAIRSISRGVDTSICSSRRIGVPSSPATPRQPSGRGAGCTIAV